MHWVNKAEGDPVATLEVNLGLPHSNAAGQEVLGPRAEVQCPALHPAALGATLTPCIPQPSDFFLPFSCPSVVTSQVLEAGIE